MRIKARTLAIAVATVGLGVAASAAVAAAPAGADPYFPPQVLKVQNVVEAPAYTHTAIVRATYQCWGGNAHTHLFIAVKQGPRVNATTHTSSDYARTFYSTNWNSDGPGLSLNCDGQVHKRAFLLKPQPGFVQRQVLLTGPAFVQFCLFDSTNTGENDPNGFAFDYSMRQVIRTGV